MYLKRRILGVVAGVAWAGLGHAQVLERVGYVQVTPSAKTVSVPKSALAGLCGVSGTLGAYTAPRHGKLDETTRLWKYDPGVAFWTLGFDSLDYVVVEENGTPRQCGLVFQLERTVPDQFPWEILDQDPELSWTLWGIYGLDDPSSGGSTGGGGGIKIRVPPPPGGLLPSGRSAAEDSPEGEVSVPVYQAFGGGGQISVLLHPQADGSYAVSAATESLSTKKVDLAPGLRHLELDWWRVPGNGTRPGGVRLLVEGRAETPLESLMPEWYSDFQAGTPYPIAGVQTSEPLSRLEQIFVPAVPLRIRTDFSGSLAPWQGAQSAHIQVVDAREAVRGKELDIYWPASQGQTTSWWAELPNADILDVDRLNVSMRVWSKAGSTGTVALLSAFANSLNQPEVLRLSLRHAFGQEELVTTLANTQTVSVPLPLTPNGARVVAHDVTLQWRSPSALGAQDGLLRIWVDRLQVLDLNTVAVGGGFETTQKLGSLRLGPHVASSGSGKLSLDNIEVWY